MKILMLTPYFPYPPSSGGQVRSYNLIKNLAKTHEITLFSLIKNESEKQYIKEMEKFCKKVCVFRRPEKPWTFQNILRTGLGLYPFLVVRNLSAAEKVAVADELARDKYDLIHAENFYVMPHIPKTDIPILLTEQTIFYRIYKNFPQSLKWFLFWLKPILMIDVLKLKKWERFYWQNTKYLAAVSKEDSALIKKLSGRKEVFIVPNGVDYQHFSQMKYGRNENPTVLFGAADFHWLQNKEGVDTLIGDVWPIIKKEVNGVILWIVGKIAPMALAAYANQKDIIIQEIEDSREAYQKAWVLVAPMLSGGGSRTKFFEAMASGLPIVTTPHGIEGIDARDGHEVIIRRKSNELATEAIKILKNQTFANKIGNNARLFVEQKYGWEESARELDKIYKLIHKENNEKH